MGDVDVLQLGAGRHDWRIGRPRSVGPDARRWRTWRARAGPQGASGKIVFGGGEAEAFSLEGGGPWEIAVPLPAGLGGGELLEVRLVVNRPFVPGAGGSTRAERTQTERSQFRQY